MNPLGGSMSNAEKVPWRSNVEKTIFLNDNVFII